MKTVIAILLLCSLFGCKALSTIVPTIDACEHFIYERHGDKAAFQATECTVPRAASGRNFL